MSEESHGDPADGEADDEPECTIDHRVSFRRAHFSASRAFWRASLRSEVWRSMVVGLRPARAEMDLRLAPARRMVRQIRFSARVTGGATVRFLRRTDRGVR